jgi:hypothetical protein
MEYLVAAIGRLESVIHNERKEMKAMQQKMDAKIWKFIEDMRVWRKWMKAGREATEACLESKEDRVREE